MRPSASDAVVVDFETTLDKKNGYTLEKMPTRAYLDDPRFDILSVSIGSCREDAIDFFHKFGGEGGGLEDARAVLEQAARNGQWLVCHNAMFDGMILVRKWGIRFAHYFDTTAILRAQGYAASLANGARVVKLEKAEAPPFIEASLHDPIKLKQFARYNAVDVDIARTLFHQAIGIDSFTDLEWWCVDMTCRENLAGVRIARDRAAILSRDYARERSGSVEKLVMTFPTFDTGAINSPPKVKAFLKTHLGVELDTLDKKDPDVVAAKRRTPGSQADAVDAATFLGLRDRVTTWDRHSKKLALIADGPERIFGALNYHAAHTGRFSGGGRDAEHVNLQNLVKGSKGDFEDLKYIRGIVVPDEGESFVSCDLSTIEPRVLALLAGQTNLLDKFRAGEDLYIWFISHLFPGTRIIKNGENDQLRQLGKHTNLGLGFGMGKAGFFERLLSEGIDITMPLTSQLHNLYHRLFPLIPDLRHRFWAMFRRAFDQGITQTWGRCTFRPISGREGRGVAIVLPTGRQLFYRSMVKRPEVTPRGVVDVYRYVDFFSFDPKLPGRGGKKSKKCGDGRLRTALDPQTIVENIVQAIARDLLVAQMREVERHGDIRVRFSVHDEGVFAVRACVCPRRDEKREKGVPVGTLHEPGCAWVRGRGIVQVEMSRVPECFPGLLDLPLACEVSDGIRASYGK